MLFELPPTVRLPGGVTVSPTVNAIAPVDVSSSIVWSGMFDIVGGPSLSVERIADAIGSIADRTVIVALPADGCGRHRHRPVRAAPPKYNVPVGN